MGNHNSYHRLSTAGLLIRLISALANWFGLDSDSVDIEKAPLVLNPVKGVRLKRVLRV